MCLPRTRLSISPRASSGGAAHESSGFQMLFTLGMFADLSPVPIRCSHWHARVARKKQTKKKQSSAPNSPSGALLQLVPASHGVRVSPAPRADTHTSGSIHSDAARRFLLDVTADSRVIPHHPHHPPSRNPGVIVARNKFTTKSRCGAHACNCAPPRRCICLRAAGQKGGGCKE